MHKNWLYSLKNNDKFCKSDDLKTLKGMRNNLRVLCENDTSLNCCMQMKCYE
jgi:hypothetical protein